MTFHDYLEQQGFQADACESTVHPDFYALAERLWKSLTIVQEHHEARMKAEKPKSGLFFYHKGRRDILRRALQP
jgi:hypothetical protein